MEGEEGKNFNKKKRGENSLVGGRRRGGSSLRAPWLGICSLKTIEGGKFTAPVARVTLSEGEKGKTKSTERRRKRGGGELRLCGKGFFLRKRGGDRQADSAPREGGFLTGDQPGKDDRFLAERGGEPMKKRLFGPRVIRKGKGGSHFFLEKKPLADRRKG